MEMGPAVGRGRDRRPGDEIHDEKEAEARPRSRGCGCVVSHRDLNTSLRRLRRTRSRGSKTTAMISSRRRIRLWTHGTGLLGRGVVETRLLALLGKSRERVQRKG